jgi:hypothetical protein
MDKNTKESFLKVISMVKGFTHGKTVIDIKEILFMTKDRVLDSTIGTMVDFIRENGRRKE